MTDALNDKRDFFISFSRADRAWATWIAWTLEGAGYSVWFQDWDFRGNFVLEMERAHKLSHRTIAVLSPDYLASHFSKPEWAARFTEDATSEHDLLIPVRVRECEMRGLLGPIVYVDLLGLDRDEARQRLLNRVAGIRPSPGEEPSFPRAVLPAAARSVSVEPSFPSTIAFRPSAIHNLPSRHPDFVGREQVLAELRRLLTIGQGPAVLTQTITGLGGIGKTQTALAYCYRHLADYRLVWWLRAESAATLAADYATLAEPLGLDPRVADQEKLLSSIRTSLQAGDRWLLVFDNVEDPELPRRYLPSTGSGHVLITSRRTDWRGLAKALPLEVLPEPEAVRLLAGDKDPAMLSAPEQAAAKELAYDLGCLPLALAQARAYMEETGEDLAGYRQLLQVSRPLVLASGRASPEYPASVARTWQVSTDAAANACPAARPLLEMLAFFAPENLPLVVLEAEPKALPEGLRSELERDEAIATLNRFSLIQAGASSITIHRLIQVVTRDRLNDKTSEIRVMAAIQLITAALPRPPQDPVNWLQIGSLLPHAINVLFFAEELKVGLEEAAICLNELSLYYRSRANWTEAEQSLRRAIAIGEMVLGSKHPDLAAALVNLAGLYRATGRYTEAEPLLRRAIEIGEEALGPNHPYLAMLLNNLAALYRDTHRQLDAEPLYKRAISMTERAFGLDNPNLASGLNNLALLYHDMGRYAEAEPLLRRALAIGENTLGPEHPTVATRLSNLAGLCRITGRLADAQHLYQRAIAINERSLGPQHPELAADLNNLAGLYSEISRYSEAEPLYRRALAILQSTLPTDHPYSGIVSENLAALLDRMDRSCEACELRAKLERIRQHSTTTSN